MTKLETWTATANDEKKLMRLVSLRDRWADEHEYEDWKDYEKVMRQLFPNLISATKRPFGVRLNCDDGPLHIILKFRASSVCFSAKL